MRRAYWLDSDRFKGKPMDLFTLVGKIVLDADGFSEKVDGVLSRVESLGNGLQKAGDKIADVGSSLTKAVTVPLAGLGAVSVKTAATFEDGMLKVQSLSGATQEEYGKLSDAAKHYGATTAWTAKDVADAMGYMALAGFDTNEILQSTSGMLSLASASGEDLATVTDILTDSMTAFGDGAGEASRYADVLATTQAKSNTTVGLLGEAFKYVAPLAGSYGYKLEDVATALGQMANAGVKGSMAGTALSSVITRLGTDTDGCRTAIEEMGVQFYNQDGTARDLSLVLKDLCDKTKNLSVEEKAATAKHIAGMEAQKGLLAILNQGSAAYSDLEGKIKSCGGAAEDMAANMESGLGGSLRSLKSALEGVAITLGEKLAPYVTKAADKIKEFTEWFQSLDDKTQNTIVKFGLLVAAAGPVVTIFGKGVTTIGTLISTGSKLIGGAGKVISVGKLLFSGGTKIATGIGSLIAKIGGGLLPALAAIPGPVKIVIAIFAALVAAGVLIYKNWDEIKEWAGKIWGKIKEIVGGAVDGIKNFFSGIIDFVKNNWQGLALLLVNPFVGGFKLLYDNCEAFRSFIDNFLGNLKEGFQNFKDNVVGKFTELKDNATEKIHELKENVTAKFSELKETVAAKASELKDNAVEKFHDLKDRAAEKFSDMKEAVVSRVEEMKENASSKIHEMGEKVSAGFQEMKDKAAEKFSDLKEKWTSKFAETREKMVSEAGEMKEKVGEKLEQFKTGTVEKIESVKTNAVQKFQELKEAAGTKISELSQKGIEGFNSIREKGSAAIENLKNAASSKFSEMGSAIHEKFNAVGEKIVGTFTRCRDTVHDIVEKIKGFFNFEWKLPDIKLPHFSIDGQFSLNPPSIPKLSVEWYAKAMNDPMIMTRPTAFGINPAGQIMAGGEAGSEVVSGTDTLMRMISAAVAENNDRVCEIMERIYTLLAEYLPGLSNRQLCLDTGALVGELAQPLNDELGWIAHTRGRRK